MNVLFAIALWKFILSPSLNQVVSGHLSGADADVASLPVSAMKYRLDLNHRVTNVP
jgi:hypothetical protein